jgi:endonuclease-8
MPEGPSIVILKEEVQVFQGKKVLKVSGNSKTELPRLLNKQITDFKSWGKHFLICFDEFFVKIHLLLFGSYGINEQREFAPRMSLEFDNGELNFYNCSIKIIEGSPDSVYDWERDIMSDNWNPVKARRSLAGLKHTLICDALLDQDIFAGVGNIIKNEVLFIEKIHPKSSVNKIPTKKLNSLIAETRRYCFDFYKWKKAYVLKKHWLVHRQKTCPSCQSALTLEYLGKRDRRTFYCANCQLLYY